MSARTITIGNALLALIGPAIWALHFFAVYLAEAVLCSPAVAFANGVVFVGAGLTIAAMIALLWVRRISIQERWRPFVRPLVDLSIVAVVLTGIPLAMIDVCRPAGA